MSADDREQLLDLPTELRGEVHSYYDGEMEAAGFARRLRSVASELERHADAIEADDEGGESGEKTAHERSAVNHPAVEWEYEQVSESGINITHFHVAESERRQGIGSSAMDALLDRFAADGYEYVVANIHGGEIARRFLTEKHDMKIVEGPNADGFVTGERSLAGRVEDGESDESEPQSDDSSNEGNESDESDDSHEHGDDTASDDSNDADDSIRQTATNHGH